MPGARAASRSGLPLPPVPAPSRGAHPSMPVPTPVATPGRMPGAPVPAGPSAGPSVGPDRGARLGAAAVVAEAPARAWDDERSAPWSTGPGVGGLGRPDVRVPAPRHDGAPIKNASYGDWTHPSRSNDTEEGLRPAAEDDARGPLLVRSAPGTTAIPEREIHRGRGEAFDDGYDADDRYDDDDDPFDRRYPGERFADEGFDSEQMAAARAGDAVRGPSTGHGTGPVGGRAALRQQRQAAEVARRKAAKGRRDKAMLDEEERPRRPRRVAISLLAMVLVALAVLGVYSFATSDTEETGAQSPATSSAPAPSPAPDTAALAPKPTPVQSVETAPTTPVRVPVTVLNSTAINGLAAKIAAQVVAGGWQSPGVGAYKGGDVAVSTVFFTEGDEQQRQAAVQLVDQFPQLHGPAPRFFEVPDVAAPGLVVVVTGDWQP
jgi:hypothetical protein